MTRFRNLQLVRFSLVVLAVSSVSLAQQDAIPARPGEQSSTTENPSSSRVPQFFVANGRPIAVVVFNVDGGPGLKINITDSAASDVNQRTIIFQSGKDRVLFWDFKNTPAESAKSREITLEGARQLTVTASDQGHSIPVETLWKGTGKSAMVFGIDPITRDIRGSHGRQSATITRYKAQVFIYNTKASNNSASSGY